VERKRRYFRTSLLENTFALGVARRSILPNVALRGQGEQRFHPEQFFASSFRMLSA
jgi:hypothetical protein